LHLVVVLVLCIGIIVPLGRLVAEDDTARQVSINVVGLVRLTGNDLIPKTHHTVPKAPCGAFSGFRILKKISST
jgi:hypothetical protein